MGYFSDRFPGLKEKILNRPWKKGKEKTEKGDKSIAKTPNFKLNTYYRRDGVFVKTDEKEENKIFIQSFDPVIIETADGPVPSSDKFVESFQEITFGNFEFLQLAAFAFNEDDDKNAKYAIANVIINRLRNGSFGSDINTILAGIAGSGIGGSHEKRLKSSAIPRYKTFFNTKPEERTKLMNISAAAGLNAIGNGIDYSKGSLYWHGKDFFLPYRKVKGKKIKNDAYWKEYLVHGFKFDDGVTASSSVQKEKIVKDKKPYLGKAAFGGTIFYIKQE